MKYETSRGTITHSLEIPVYHTTRMEIAEALSNIAQLVKGNPSDNRNCGKKDAHQSEFICIGVFLDVFRQVTARHPIRDKLVVVDSNAQ